MKQNEVKVGGTYSTTLCGSHQKVVVEQRLEPNGIFGCSRTEFKVRTPAGNLVTRSAAALHPAGAAVNPVEIERLMKITGRLLSSTRAQCTSATTRLVRESASKMRRVRHCGRKSFGPGKRTARRSDWCDTDVIYK